MFKKLFIKSKASNKVKLVDIVKITNNTGYIFGNIMNDLGESTEDIMENSKLIQMSYGYARRSAAIALYLQGLIDEDVYDHNLSFFKAIQLKTEHSVEFQENAFSDSIEYMKSYNPIITRLLIKNMTVLAQTFVPPKEKLSDVELTEIVMGAYAS